jgi:hypothetical protein
MPAFDSRDALAVLRDSRAEHERWEAAEAAVRERDRTEAELDQLATTEGPW